MSTRFGIHDDSPVQDRLASVKNAIRKATEEALKQASTEMSGKLSSDGEKGRQQFHSSITENSDPNASFHLGMELFGQEVGVVESNIRLKLDHVEKELDGIRKLLSRQGFSGSAGAIDESVLEEDDQQIDPEQLQSESVQLNQMLNFLRQCSLARSLLDESVTLSSPSLSPDLDWVEAARRLSKSQNALQEAEALLQSTSAPQINSQALGTGYKILDSIASSIRRQRVDLIHHTTTLFHNCVSITETSIQVRTAASKGAHTGGLDAAFDVLEVLDSSDNAKRNAKTPSTLEATLHKFARTIFDKVLKPTIPTDLSQMSRQTRQWKVWDSKEDNATSAMSTTTKPSRTLHRLDWTIEETSLVGGKQRPEVLCVDNWRATLAFCSRIVEFLAVHIFNDRERMRRVVGSRLFGKPGALPNNLKLQALGLEDCLLGEDDGLFMEALVDAMAITCIPVRLKPTEVATLQDMARDLKGATGPFVQSLVSNSFLVLDSDSRTRLQDFSECFEQKYIDSRRNHILNKARNLLLKNDYHNTVVAGVEPRAKKDDVLGMEDGLTVFLLHRASVSETAFQLMELSRKTMDESVDHVSYSHDSIALLSATLYRSAREILDLFRAVIPTVHGREIANIPRTAAVLHNDCVFFAHHCLTLGLEYGEKYQAAEVTTVDEVDKEEFGEGENESNRGNLLKQTCIFVDMVPLFRELADNAMGNMLERQKVQLVEIVGSRITLLGESLRSDESVAEWSDADSAMTAGLYHLRHLAQAWSPILATDVFKRSVGYLADCLCTLYLDEVISKASDISESACHFVSALFQRAAESIQELLEGDKISGSRLYDRFLAVGKFMDMSLMDIQANLADGFFLSVTGPELSRLILATFSESPKRERLLLSLKSH